MAATSTANGNSEIEDEIPSSQHNNEESEDEEDIEEPEEEEEDNTISAADQVAQTADGESKRWYGWPGDSVFRLIVPVLKVGGIIGRKGELIKKLCEETRARVRILDGPIGTSDRIVLISAKEEADLEMPPAIDAVLRVFKRVNGLSEGTGDEVDLLATASTTCSIRLLVPSSQAFHLIGKHGVLIKSIQESTGASLRVLTADELPHYVTGDERIVEIYSETPKVLKTLEVVVGHLRKFLVDHSVIPLFEKNFKTPAAHDREPEDWSNRTQSLIGNDYELPVKRSSLYLDHESQLDSQFQRSSLSLYGQDPSLSALRSSGSSLGRTGVPLVTQVTQTMQIPLSYAEDIIGIGGGNIAYIRRSSGAVLTVQETRGISDEITVEIKGTASQVQIAQQLIQEFIAGHKDHVPSSYGSLDTDLRSSYSLIGRSDYSSTSSLGGYGGYGSYMF